ncbi:MAG: VCBS repeat-containing protein, partial [Thiotrichaceae bacterium]
LFSGGRTGDGYDSLYFVYGGDLGTGNSLEEAGIQITHDMAADNKYITSGLIADINGDGWDDILVGLSPTGVIANRGSIAVFFGSDERFTSLDIDDDAGLIFISDQHGEPFAETMAAGDFNNDGVDDLLIGETVVRSPEETDYRGSSWLILGNSAWSNTPQNNPYVEQVLHMVPQDAAFNWVTNTDARENYGTVGFLDFNGDGFADMVAQVGPQEDPASTDYGVALIFGMPLYGEEGTDNIKITLLNEGGVINLEHLEPAQGTIFTPYKSEALTRSINMETGNLNGDAFDDLIINDVTGGSITIIFGSDTVPVAAKTNYETTTDYDTLTLTPAESNRFGYYVTAGSDYNGDGINDLLVSDYKANSTKGAVWLIWGDDNFADLSTTILDEMRDGTAADDVGIYFTLGNMSHWRLTGVNGGDLNGDGTDDITFVDNEGLYVIPGSTDLVGIPSIDLNV